ncbi:MFS general substrate transporter [Cytidiella melzeri]|nr:MFS general substrate transporter [Cytidiella melzeri]
MSEETKSQSDVEKGVDVTTQEKMSGSSSEIDLLSYHETNAGRLVIDLAEARIEFGDEVADKLKLSADGTTVLWPQPRDDPEDPQNWSDFHKNLQLFIITLAAIVPDFDSGIGIADIFALSVQYDTTTGVINNLTSNTCPQVTGLYIVTDLFPFHLQARKARCILNLWTMGFIISPFLSPFLFGFMVARTSWRWTYGVGTFYGGIVTGIIALFGEETMYDRKLPNPTPFPRPAFSLRSFKYLRYRAELLLGVTGIRMAKYRSSWTDVVSVWFKLIWRPHLLGILLFEAMVFGFSIGVNVTNVVFVQLPPPVGYGFSQFATAGIYGTPIVAVIIGELLGRYFNDWVMRFCIRRNNGVFEVESRLWTCYIAIPLYICGFVLIGASFQNHLSVGALVMGWGIAEVAVMINTVAVCEYLSKIPVVVLLKLVDRSADAYCNDCFPRFRGEISAMINLARTLGGFSVAFFQVPWATKKSGALQPFGCEAAIVAGLFILIVPLVQYHGRSLRHRFSL